MIQSQKDTKFSGMGNSNGMHGSNGTNNDTKGMDNNTMGYDYVMNHTFYITDQSGECPAHAETFKFEELDKLGIHSQDDILYYMASIGPTFGEISDEDLQYVPNHLEGLQFTKNPIDLCELLFDEYTLKLLNHPE